MGLWKGRGWSLEKRKLLFLSRAKIAVSWRLTDGKEE